MGSARVGPCWMGVSAGGGEGAFLGIGWVGVGSDELPWSEGMDVYLG